MNNALLTIVKVTPTALSRGITYSFALQYQVEQGRILMNGYLEAGVTINPSHGVSDSLRLNANTVVFDDGRGPHAEVSPAVKAGKIKALSGILDIMETNGCIRLGKLKTLTGLVDDDIVVIVQGQSRAERQHDAAMSAEETTARQIGYSFSDLMGRYRISSMTFNYLNGQVDIIHARGYDATSPSELVTDTFIREMKKLLLSLDTRALSGGFSAQLAFAGDSVIRTRDDEYVVPVYMSEVA